MDERYLTTSYERDWETGLDYRGARFYDSEVGRFLSLDPMAIELPEMSPYNYVLGNPAIITDPDGKFPCFGCRYFVDALAAAFEAKGMDLRLALQNPMDTL